MKTLNRLLTLSLSLVFVMLSIPTWRDVGFALSEQHIAWSQPMNLTNTPTGSLQQTITGDLFGYAHFFWVEDYEGTLVEELFGRVPSGNTIFYRYWDGMNWSEPVDLFFVPAGSLSYPTAEVDDEGMIYLVWETTAGLSFSSAPVAEAGNALRWMPEQILTDATGYKPALLVRGDNRIDLIYSAFSQGGRKDGNLYHIQSLDGGGTWSLPNKLTTIANSSGTLAVFPRLVEDEAGRLHVAWYETDPPDYLGSAVYYARSTDDGLTWSAPVRVAESTAQSPWSSAVQVASAGSDEIHLTWVCGQLAYRCHQMSVDGGESWSSPQRVFGGLHSLAIWDAIISAPGGHIYWFIQLRYPEGLYYSYWDGHGWLDPPGIVDTRVIPQGHAPQIALTGGNQFHLVVNDQAEWDVWWIYGESNLMAPIPNLAFPASLPSPPSVATDVPAMSLEVEPQVLSPPALEPRTGTSQTNPGMPLILSVGGVILVLGAVLALKGMRRK